MSRIWGRERGRKDLGEGGGGGDGGHRLVGRAMLKLDFSNSVTKKIHACIASS